MSDFRVWAPDAHSVDLILNPRPDLRMTGVSEKRVPLRPCGHGWWSGDTPPIAPDTDYAYAINGGNPLPDPRSPWQPRGIHGPSRTVDHAAFPWTDHQWQPPSRSAAIIYELHIGTFTPESTFDGAIAKLGYLVQLGITHVELMPVAEFPGERGWGYDGVDLFAPHHAWGGPEGLKRFVDACHSRGLAVILDVVYNHLGPDGNYLGSFGPYFTDRYQTPWGKAVNLDGPDSVEVRRFFCDNAGMWLRDYHIDGLRLDAIHALFDMSAVHFLEQLAAETRELEKATGRQFFLIAESDLNDPRTVTSPCKGGYGFDAQWSDDFHHALHTVLTGETSGYYSDFGTLADLAKSLKEVFVYDGRESAHRGRTHGRPVHELSGNRFVGFLQNHDQVGNRAAGDRITSILSVGHLKTGAALVLCSPFLPLVFQGEEFGATSPFLYFTDHSDPELAAAVSVGRRQEFASFGWKPEDVPDPQGLSAFSSSQLDWSQVSRHPHAELLRWYRSLIALRRSTTELNDGDLSRVRVEFSEHNRWLVLYRGSVAVVCNLSGARQSIALRFPVRPLLASDPDFAVKESMVDLAGESVLICEEDRLP